MNDEKGILFVTGATGPTASRAVVRLIEAGWRLRCLVRTEENRRYLPGGDRIEIIPGDLNRPGEWEAGLDGAAAALHMAHIRFAQLIVRACEGRDVRRLICISSTRRFTRFPEETSRSVIEGEAAVEASQLNATILRPAMIYGSERDNNVGRIVRWLRRRRWMPLVRGGTNLVQPLFTDDLVDAIVRCIDRPEQTGRRAFNLAGPEPIAWKAMIEIVAEQMGRPVRWIPVPYRMALAAAAVAEFSPGRSIATRDQVRRLLEDKDFDISEATRALGGWRPRPFREGVKLKLTGLDSDPNDGI